MGILYELERLLLDGPRENKIVEEDNDDTAVSEEVKPPEGEKIAREIYDEFSQIHSSSLSVRNNTHWSMGMDVESKLSNLIRKVRVILTHASTGQQADVVESNNNIDYLYAYCLDKYKYLSDYLFVDGCESYDDLSPLLRVLDDKVRPSGEQKRIYVKECDTDDTSDKEQSAVINIILSSKDVFTEDMSEFNMLSHALVKHYETYHSS